MERRTFGRFSIVAAFAFALLALASFPAARSMAQDEVVVPIAELNDSGVSGDASLTDNGDGTTTVDILVVGATGGHPAHIHSGTCTELGDVVYPLTDVNARGESVTVIDVPLADLQTAGPYAINIHLSADEIGTYVACGEIPQTAAGDETTAPVEATASPTAAASPAVGGTSSVTYIGTSGVGTTFGGNTSLFALAIAAAALFALAGAFSLRRREPRG
ncbi:MAG TPA: CHRD domain-containing protein [Thermomicrobiales bacterium]|nr:CHRD domain-containing protein [Thermomicrobiales bacterium]